MSTAYSICFSIHAQISIGSIPDTYVQENWISVRFQGDGQGNCIATPPDVDIEHRLILSDDFSAVKTMGTTYHHQIHFSLFGQCDTAYVGQWELIGDTVVVTYNRKPRCDIYLFKPSNDDPKKLDSHYEKIDPPLVERYYLRMIDGEFYALMLRDKEVEWEEQYRKEE